MIMILIVIVLVLLIMNLRAAVVHLADSPVNATFRPRKTPLRQRLRGEGLGWSES